MVHQAFCRKKCFNSKRANSVHLSLNSNYKNSVKYGSQFITTPFKQQWTLNTYPEESNLEVLPAPSINFFWRVKKKKQNKTTHTGQAQEKVFVQLTVNTSFRGHLGKQGKVRFTGCFSAWNSDPRTQQTPRLYCTEQPLPHESELREEQKREQNTLHFFNWTIFPWQPSWHTFSGI